MPTRIQPIGMLKNYVGGQNEVIVEPGQSVREMLAALKIPSEIVALVAVNGEMQNKDYLLQDGDVIRLMAVIGGG